jgi:hypothetical protein
MIELSFDRSRRILLVRCQLALTHQNFDTFDGLLAKFVAREGTSDTIVDFRGLPPSDLRSPEFMARGRRPSRMPGRRRVYVADSDLVFGSLRMYSAYQHRSGATPPMVVRSLEEALNLLDAVDAIFEPVNLD